MTMTSAGSTNRNKFLKFNGHSDTILPRDRIHPPHSTKLSPQFSLKCSDNTQLPSSSEDDPSDMSADESDSQGPAGHMTTPTLKQRMTDEFDVESEFSKRPPRSSSWTDSDLSIIVAVVTPLVNWLTGNDLLKNLFLILFSIVYLHQLVQGMW